MDNVLISEDVTQHKELVVSIHAWLPKLQTLELSKFSSELSTKQMSQLIRSGIRDIKLQVTSRSDPYLTPEDVQLLAEAAASGGVRSLALLPNPLHSRTHARLYAGQVRHLMTGAASSPARLDLALQGLYTEAFFRKVMQKHGVEVEEVRVWEPVTNAMHVTLRCGQQVTEVVSPPSWVQYRPGDDV